MGTPGVSPGGATPPLAAPKAPPAAASEAPTGLRAPQPAALPNAVVFAATSWKRPAPALQPPSASGVLFLFHTCSTGHHIGTIAEVSPTHSCVGASIVALTHDDHGLVDFQAALHDGLWHVAGPTMDKRPVTKLVLSEDTAAALKGSRQPSAEAEHCMVDAGLLMGRSFRVGWGPNGRLVHPGEPQLIKPPHHCLRLDYCSLRTSILLQEGLLHLTVMTCQDSPGTHTVIGRRCAGMKTTATEATPIVMRSLPITTGVVTKAAPEASTASFTTRTRERWRQLLSIHAAHSSPSASTMVCTAAHILQTLW